MSEKIHTDIAVVGAGIAGLWAAKEIVDRGYSVTLIERSTTLADGATTRNEGWLHAGTYHSVAVEETSEIAEVVANTRYGHHEIVGFAPDAVDHAASFAVTTSDEMSEKAVHRWTESGVPFTEIDKESLAEEGLDTSRLSSAFAVQDKSINTRVLCKKLAAYVAQKGANFLMEANFTPEDEKLARVQQGERGYDLHSERFLITAGAGLKQVVEQITGEPLPMRFFKAHLLVSPRLTEHNYFHLEPGEAGFMNHGQGSVIGINRDGLEVDVPDNIASGEKKTLLHEAITRMIPRAAQFSPQENKAMTVVCHKPDVRKADTETQSLDITMFNASPNYLCALPGKMTTAPHLGRLAADRLTEGMLLSIPVQQVFEPDNYEVTPRPLDGLRIY